MAMDPAHFRRLARYNRWANARLYAACAALPEAEYLKARPAFFKSLHGTLSHILVGDRLWLARFEGKPPPGHRLGDILYGDLIGLKVAREAEDARILQFTAALDPAALDRPLSYRNVAGETWRQPLDQLLTHFFNHQTHHRGQAHDQLSQTAVPPPDLDFVYFMREPG
jgi:uncharacterized damage-inducible protein DinB